MVSDQGYLDHTSIVFETLTDVDNDSLFTDGYGRIWRKPEPVDASEEFVLIIFNKWFLFCLFSRDLAMAIHNEEERLYQEAQLQEQQQQQSQGNSNPVPRSPSKQPKKSKTKSRRSSHDDDEKESSCNLF